MLVWIWTLAADSICRDCIDRDWPGTVITLVLVTPHGIRGADFDYENEISGDIFSCSIYWDFPILRCDVDRVPAAELESERETLSNVFSKELLDYFLSLPPEYQYIAEEFLWPNKPRES